MSSSRSGIMATQQRKDEILAKRAKLEELRRTRAQRESERSHRQSGIPTPLEVFLNYISEAGHG